MKNITFLFTLLLFFSCQNGTEDRHLSDRLATMDLSEMKDLMSQKKKEMNELENQIRAIQGKMEEIDPTQRERKMQKITAFRVTDTVFEHFITVQGLLEADETVGVNAEVNGRIRRLGVTEGEYVRKGDMVAELDLEQLDKQYEELEKSYELATEMYDRQKRLWDQNIGSEVQFLQAKNEKERLEKSMETLDFQRTKGGVAAPVSGVVDEVHIREGEIASPGMPIATILDVSRLKVVADVPENYLGSVSAGDRVDVRFPSVDLEMTGRVILIGSKIDRANRTFKIEVRVPRTGKHMKPNLLAEVSVNDQRLEDVITVPINLVQQEISGREFLMVVDRAGEYPLARKAYIKRGPSNQYEVVIEEGITAGDEVIDKGSQSVKPGSPVEIISRSFSDQENGAIQ